jgi:nitrite reductase (NADH) small subunit
MIMNEWLKVCTVEDIPVLGSRVIRRTQGADVALFRNAENEVFALLDRCPHRGGALSQGIVFGNWNIALDCGEAVAPDAGCTPSFAVRVEADAVFLDAKQLATLGLDAPPPSWPKVIRVAT